VKKALIIILTICAAAIAQGDLPRIAVYVRGGINDEAKTAFRKELLFTLVKSERYRAIDDNEAFAAALNSLAASQNGGDLNNTQIAQTGGSVNADFVCVVDVSPVLGSYQIFSRVIDVKDNSVEKMGRAAGPVASASDVAQIADKLVESMFETPAASPSAAAPAVPVSQRQTAPAPEYTPEPAAEPITQEAAPVAAPQKPKGPIKAAVYVTGISAMVAKPLNSAISSALMKSKIYAGIESIDVSGAPNTPALVTAGNNAGVSYVFAINVSGTISVTIIDVDLAAELAKISIDGQITAINAGAIAKKIVDFILKSGPQPDPDAQYADADGQEELDPSMYRIKRIRYDEPDGKPRRLKKRIILEYVSVAFSPFGSFNGSDSYQSIDTIRYSDGFSYWDSISYRDTTVPYSGSGIGVGWSYLCLDLIYAELLWGGTCVFGKERKELQVEAVILVKYPIGNDIIKVTPLLGCGTVAVDINAGGGRPYILGSRVEVGITETAYLRSEYLCGLGGESLGMSFKIGGGFDIGLGKRKRTYIRPELLYNWGWTEERYNSDGITHHQERTINHLDLRCGIGYKWGGNSVKEVKVPIRLRPEEPDESEF